MKQNKDTQKTNVWFWDLPGNVELMVPSSDFKKGDKELLQSIRKVYGEDLSYISLQDVHHNLPIGANRKDMECNVVSLLNGELENHPLNSYRTLAEDDMFLVIGDTQSPDIRAYRKMSEAEVLSVLTEYAKDNDLSIEPLNNDLQELASKIVIQQKEQTYYSQVAFLQFEEDTKEFDKLQDKEDYKGILTLADSYDDGDAINQHDTFLHPEHYSGDELLDEDDRYAVVYNNSIGGTYSVFRVVSEDDIRLSIERYGLDPYASKDVKDIFNRYMAEKEVNGKEYSLDNSQGDVVQEENIGGYQKDIANKEEFSKNGYQVWAEKDFPEGYYVQPMSRKEFPFVGYLPLRSIANIGENVGNTDLMFNVGNERLALYILSQASPDTIIDKRRYQERVATFNQIRELHEQYKAKPNELTDVDKSIVEDDIAKGYFFINVKTPASPMYSFTMVVSPKAVNHGVISEPQMQYAKSRGAVVLRTSKEEFDEIILKENKYVNSVDSNKLGEIADGALSRLNRNLGILKDSEKHTNLHLYEDRFQNGIIKEMGTVLGVYERTFEQDAKKLEGMYYFDSLKGDYASIGKLKYDEHKFPEYSFATSSGYVNTYALINDLHEGLLKTKEEVLSLRSDKEHNINHQNSKTMTQKEKPQVKQEEASLTQPKAESKEKTANERKEEIKQHRPPQMVTVNGEKVSHAHAFQSTMNPENWYFTARLDGQQLRPMRMSKEDVKAYQEKAIRVEDLMQHYYPTKLAKKITPEEYKADIKLSDGRTVDKMTVYKEHDPQRKDVGKYKIYAQVGDNKMSRTMSTEDLNAFFDRVTTPAKLVEKNFGEQLHLASAYKKYQLPENSGVEKVSIHKNPEGAYVISANLGDKGMTPEHKMEWVDLYAYFQSKTATREQLAAKYLMPDIKAAQSQKNNVSHGLKI